MAEVKKSKNKKVLAASLILAALIVASSSFAWLTSTDEVVNRLSANSEYSVVVTESFTPPKQWVPGQEINKDAGAVNTGSTDAYVKLTLTNTMTLTTYGTSENYSDSNTGNYDKLDEDEIKAAQAGGVLVYKAGRTVDEAYQNVGTNYNSKDYYERDGLYLFRKTVTDTNSNGTITTSYTYNGYYLVKETKTDANENSIETYTYYAIDTTEVKGDTTYSSAKLKTIEKTVVYPELAYDSKNSKLVAKYSGADSTSEDDDIAINITLKNVLGSSDTPGDSWTYNKKTATTENTKEAIFYYNKLLASGETADLVDSVELDKSVTSKAYIDFDYDLKITADSVQVTRDNNGYVTTDGVDSEWASDYKATYNNGEDTKDTDKAVTWKEK